MDILPIHGFHWWHVYKFRFSRPKPHPQARVARCPFRTRQSGSKSGRIRQDEQIGRQTNQAG